MVASTVSHKVMPLMAQFCRWMNDTNGKVGDGRWRLRAAVRAPWPFAGPWAAGLTILVLVALVLCPFSIVFLASSEKLGPRL